MKKKTTVFVGLIVAILLIFAIGHITGDNYSAKPQIDKNEECFKKKITGVKEKKPEISEITITCWGDYMNHITQIHDARANNYDFTDSFSVIKPIVEKSDLAIVNLETTIAKDEDSLSGYPMFKTHKNVIKALKSTGFDVISTANNHSFDGRFSGIDNTIDEIEKNGLQRTGTFKENEPRDPLIVDVNGIKVGFFSATEMLNGFEDVLQNSDRDYSVNLINMDRIEKEISYLKDKKADIIMCYIHWGEEYSDNPNEFQKNTFKKLSDLGVDLVIGSHPHTIERDDVIKNQDKNSY